MQNRNSTRLIASILAALVLSACQTSSYQSQSKPAPKSYEPYLLSESEKAQVRRGLASSLKDPDSARFSETFAAAKDADGVITVCGYVNAKNSFGGFTGDQPFIGVMTTESFVPVSFGATDIERAVTLRHCQKLGVIG